MVKEEWIRRCADQYKKRAALEEEVAMEFAETCFQESYDDFENQPEICADEEMSCWTED